jgi:hypothetical protein
LVAIYNSLPGVTPTETFKTAKTGASKIWESIQGLGKAANAPAKPKTSKKAKGSAKGQERARQGQGDQAGDPCQARAQSQEIGRDRREAQGRTRRLQNGPSGRDAATQERRYTFRDHGQNGLAKTYGEGLHGRRNEEGRVRRRILQAGRGERSYRINA